MPWYHKRLPRTELSEERIFDDGGSGLFDACTARFAKLGWSIRCDSCHAVWVKSPHASLSVGLAPWMAARLPIEQVLDEAEEKIRAAEAASPAQRSDDRVRDQMRPPVGLGVARR